MDECLAQIPLASALRTIWLDDSVERSSGIVFTGFAALVFRSSSQTKCATTIICCHSFSVCEQNTNTHAHSKRKNFYNLLSQYHILMNRITFNLSSFFFCSCLSDDCIYILSEWKISTVKLFSNFQMNEKVKQWKLQATDCNKSQPASR